MWSETLVVTQFGYSLETIIDQKKKNNKRPKDQTRITKHAKPITTKKRTLTECDNVTAFFSSTWVNTTTRSSTSCAKRDNKDDNWIWWSLTKSKSITQSTVWTITRMICFVVEKTGLKGPWAEESCSFSFFLLILIPKMPTGLRLCIGQVFVPGRQFGMTFFCAMKKMSLKLTDKRNVQFICRWQFVVNCGRGEEG